MTETTTPAGWYRDAQMPGQMRYWDGAAWTAHVAPIAGAPAPGTAPAAALTKRRSSASVVLIIVGVVLGVLMIIGVLAAIAIPIFLNQQSRAHVAAARSDAAAIAVEASIFAVNTLITPEVTMGDGVYVVGTAEQGYTEVPASPGVTLQGYSVSGADLCVATTTGDVTAHHSSVTGSGDGPCP